MLGWLKILKKKFNKLNSIVQIAIALIAVIALRYAILLLQYHYYSSSLENFSNPKKLVYFHMDTCGHCKKFNPEWDKFASNYNGPLEIKKVVQIFFRPRPNALATASRFARSGRKRSLRVLI